MRPSESARATAAAESRFRVRTPNALPRAVAVVALDAPTAALATTLAARIWRGTTFFTVAPEPPPDAGTFAHWLRSIAGQAVDLVDTVSRADVVQMLTVAGQPTPAASLIGEACALRGVKTSGVVIDEGAAGGGAADGEAGGGAALSRSLRTLRPWVMTLSVIGSSGDVDEILHALGG